MFHLQITFSILISHTEYPLPLTWLIRLEQPLTPAREEKIFSNSIIIAKQIASRCANPFMLLSGAVAISCHMDPIQTLLRACGDVVWAGSFSSRIGWKSWDFPVWWKESGFIEAFFSLRSFLVTLQELSRAKITLLLENSWDCFRSMFSCWITRLSNWMQKEREPRSLQ